MTDQLKACPFCGSTEGYVERYDYSSCYRLCEGCLARGPLMMAEDEDEEIPGQDPALVAWNTRTQAEDGEAVAWLEVEPGVSLTQAISEYGMYLHSMQVHLGRKQPAKAQGPNGLFPLYTHPPRAQGDEPTGKDRLQVGDAEPTVWNDRIVTDADLTYAAIQRAAGELPEGYEIQIGIEKDAGWVELIGPDGEIEYPTNRESIADQVNDAIDAALSAQRGEADHG